MISISRAALCGALAVGFVYAAPAIGSLPRGHSAHVNQQKQHKASRRATRNSVRSGRSSPNSSRNASDAAIVGAASTYNPFRPGYQEGGIATASGENYDASSWTAAIQTNLRAFFGGVRGGKKYQPTFALVECEEKKAVVKINDVGPLKPGRIIDLNEHAMRYFDPSLRRGVISKVKVTPLKGNRWTAGPIPKAG